MVGGWEDWRGGARGFRVTSRPSFHTREKDSPFGCSVTGKSRGFSCLALAGSSLNSSGFVSVNRYGKVTNPRRAARGPALAAGQDEGARRAAGSGFPAALV